MSSKTSGADPGLESQPKAHDFVKFLSRHFVSIAGTAIALGPDGNPCGEEVFFSYSGFVVSLHGCWLLMTAGHILKELDDHFRTNSIRLQCYLVDYFGPHSDSQFTIPFNYEEQDKVCIDDDKAGLDFGLILLRPDHRRLLEVNGVVAIAEQNWLLQHQVVFHFYAVLGTPSELFEFEKRKTPAGLTVVGAVRPVLMAAVPTDEKPRNKPQPAHPWFAAALKDKSRIKSIKGMSGGPIFGFRVEPGKRALYWVVAIQGWWDKERRIVFGSRLSTVMTLVINEIDAFVVQHTRRSRNRKKPASRKPGKAKGRKNKE